MPSLMLGQVNGQPIPLAWQPPMNPPMVQVYFDILMVPSHQPLGTPTSHRVDLDKANIVLGVPIEPPTRR